MPDAVAIDVRVSLEVKGPAGDEGKAGADPRDRLGDPREALERDRRAAEGAAPPAPEPVAPEPSFWDQKPDIIPDRVVERPPAELSPEDIALRDEVILLGRRVGELERQPDPAEVQGRRALALRTRVERVIEERQKEDGSEEVVAEMRERLAWLDEKFGDDFEAIREAQGGGGVAGALEGAGGHLSSAAAFIRSPLQGAAAIGSRIAAGLPGGPVGIAAATLATIATAVAPMIIRTLSQKGWPLNRDYRRAITEEVNGAMDVRQQQDRLQGRDQYVFAQSQGFGTVDGTNVVNSLLRRDELRINMRTQAEQAIGGFY